MEGQDRRVQTTGCSAVGRGIRRSRALGQGTQYEDKLQQGSGRDHLHRTGQGRHPGQGGNGHGKPGGSVEVNIHKKSCNGRRECTRKVESIVSRALGRRMTANQSTCTAMGRDECVLRLLEAEEFQVSTGVARKPGKSGEVSGDSYSFNALAHGKYMLALSDGMGIGHKARRKAR